jgi:hypothetical protein
VLLATAEGVERSTNRTAIARSAILRKVEQLKKIGTTLDGPQKSILGRRGSKTIEKKT